MARMGRNENMRISSDDERGIVEVSFGDDVNGFAVRVHLTAADVREIYTEAVLRLRGTRDVEALRVPGDILKLLVL